MPPTNRHDIHGTVQHTNKHIQTHTHMYLQGVVFQTLVLSTNNQTYILVQHFMDTQISIQTHIVYTHIYVYTDKGMCF